LFLLLQERKSSLGKGQSATVDSGGHMIGADPTCRDSQEKEAFSMHACSSPDSHSFFLSGDLLQGYE